MSITRTLASLSIICVMANACAGPDGYYDSRGHYHTDNGYRSPYAAANDGKNYVTDYSAKKGDSAGVIGYDRTRDEEAADDATIIYKRPGYYDMNGTYYSRNAGPRVPRTYFPSRGMCRVWLDGVAPQDQPAVESCAGIPNRVPAGAYVIYGG